jgi:dTDP-4-amino-4,6-dideoxygalactose transaminase
MRILAAVDSGQYILGPECRAFERELAAYFGREHCVLVGSATAAIQLTLHALGVGPGDEVLAPSHTAFPSRVAARYRERLAGLPLGLPVERKWAEPVHHLFVVRTRERDAIARGLAERGIQTGIHYPVPNHLEPATLGRGVRAEALPRTEAWVRDILSLPIFPSLALADPDRVADAVGAFFAGRGSRDHGSLRWR